LFQLNLNNVLRKNKFDLEIQTKTKIPIDPSTTILNKTAIISLSLENTKIMAGQNAIHLSAKIHHWRALKSR